MRNGPQPTRSFGTIALLTLLELAGCGLTQTIAVQTTPPGARVRLCDYRRSCALGSTPLRFDHDRAGKVAILLEMDGYEYECVWLPADHEVRINKELRPSLGDQALVDARNWDRKQLVELLVILDEVDQASRGGCLDNSIKKLRATAERMRVGSLREMTERLEARCMDLDRARSWWFPLASPLAIRTYTALRVHVRRLRLILAIVGVGTMPSGMPSFEIASPGNVSTEQQRSAD